MGRTSETTRPMLDRGNGTEEAQFSRDGSFFPNANAGPSLEDLSPQHHVGAGSRSVIYRIADQNYDGLTELDLAAFALNDIPAFRGPQGFASDGRRENRQFFSNASTAFQGPYGWPNAVHADAGNGVHLPGLVPAPPAHFYPPESNQAMEFGMPFKDGDNGVLGTNVIELVESEFHATQPLAPHYQGMEVGPFRCDPCDTTIKRKSDFERHMKTTVRHGGRRHICPKCGHSYTRQTTFRDHKCKARQSKRL